MITCFASLIFSTVYTVLTVANYIQVEDDLVNLVLPFRAVSGRMRNQTVTTAKDTLISALSGTSWCK